MTAFLDLPLKSIYTNVSGATVTRNVGTLGGTVLIGDGSTAAKMPSLVYPRGLQSSSDLRYIKSTVTALGTDGAIFVHYLFTAPFSAVTSITQIGTASTWFTNGIFLGVNTTTKVVSGYWGSSSGPVSATVNYLGNHTIVFSSISSQMSLFWDGALVSGPLAIGASVSKTDWSAIGDPGVSYNSTAGILRNVKIFPHGLSLQQAKHLHEMSKFV